MKNEDEAYRSAAQAAIDAFSAERDPYEIRHTVQITSFGGSGTTALCRSFMDAGVDLQPGPAQWPFKHARTPPRPDDVPGGFRVVYPLSDPRDAILSIFRRNYQYGHWRALRHGDDAEMPESIDDLGTFVAAGVDEFLLPEHLDAWLAHPPGYDVMFVRFDAIDEAWPDVAEFVGLPADHPPVVRRARHSDWRQAEPAIRDGLDELYGALAARIESFPPTRIVR